MILPYYDTILSIATRRLRALRPPTMLFRRYFVTACLLLVGVVVLVVAAKADDAAVKPLTPVEARNKVGENILLEMTVKTAKDRLEKRGEIYLDAELDFRDEKNFATVINREGAFHFQEQGVKDFEEHFRGKTIRVKGTVTVVDDIPRIEVSDAKQVEVVEKK